jgi:protein involved in ribonucleotide reduction
MATSIPVQVIPVFLSDAYCPASYQELNLAMMAAKWSVNLGNVSTFIIGPTAPDHTQYPDSIWIETDAYGAPVRAYMWSGDVPNPLNKWISPHRIPPSSKEVSWFTGSVEEIAIYEGGTAGTATIDSGPFWELVPQLAGRVPIGVNDATTGGPDLTLPQYALGAINTGSETTPLGTALLTFDNLPHHAHGIGDVSADPDNNMGFIYQATGMTVQELYGVPTLTVNWDCENAGLVGTARSVSIVKTFTMDAANSQTSSREVTGVNVLPPVLALHPIRRTIRAYYSAL